ncbi:MAG: DUF2190 family protein [Candidatus Accumulibacter sp.]|jgi:hypothetical protein|nr:DUF2190 family protein [Accumulibacter sp.]
MKAQNVVLTVSFHAEVDLAASRFVDFDGAYAAAGAKALGVVDAETGADNYAPINVLGVMLVEAGGAVPAGSEVEVGADGKALAKDTGAGNGFAIDAAIADGDLIRIVRGI